MSKGDAIEMARISLQWAMQILDQDAELYRKDLNELLGHLEGSAQLVRNVLSEEL